MVLTTHPLLALRSSRGTAVPLLLSLPSWHVTGRTLSAPTHFGLQKALLHSLIPGAQQYAFFMYAKKHNDTSQFSSLLI